LWQQDRARDRLEFLPPYRPEINPDELAWADVKMHMAQATAQAKGKRKAMVDRTLYRSQKLPEIVAGFSCTPTCRYTAQ
jgi:transposase